MPNESCPAHLDGEGQSLWEQCSWIVEGGAVAPDTQLQMLALYIRRELRLESEVARLREQVKKPDWRIGLSCKPKMRSHELYYERGKIIDVHPSGFGNIADESGVLTIQMETGRVLVAPAEEWITA